MSEDERHPHPFADVIGLSFDGAEDGKSRCRVTLRPQLFNPHGVVHGAESAIFESDRLVAKALGTYSIHTRSL